MTQGEKAWHSSTEARIPRRVRDGGLRTLGSVGRQKRNIVQLLNGTLSCTVSGDCQGQEAIASHHIEYNETMDGAG